MGGDEDEVAALVCPSLSTSAKKKVRDDTRQGRGKGKGRLS